MDSSVWFAVPEPRRGGLIIAKGKAAEAAALGKETPHPTSFFSAGLARQAGREKRGNHFAPGTQGGAALALGLSYRPYGTSVWLAPLA